MKKLFLLLVLIGLPCYANITYKIGPCEQGKGQCIAYFNTKQITPYIYTNPEEDLIIFKVVQEPVITKHFILAYNKNTSKYELLNLKGKLLDVPANLILKNKYVIPYWDNDDFYFTGYQINNKGKRIKTEFKAEFSLNIKTNKWYKYNKIKSKQLYNHLHLRRYSEDTEDIYKEDTIILPNFNTIPNQYEDWDKSLKDIKFKINKCYLYKHKLLYKYDNQIYEIIYKNKLQAIPFNPDI